VLVVWTGDGERQRETKERTALPSLSPPFLFLLFLLLLRTEGYGARVRRIFQLGWLRPICEFMVGHMGSAAYRPFFVLIPNLRNGFLFSISRAIFNTWLWGI
jgi:hypothetical protein